MEIETLTEVIVASDDAAEIRRVTLINTSKRTRHFELTSYAEIALAPHAADRAHPAFSKLFVQTEAIPEQRALLANRRLRSPDDAPIWAVHAVVGGEEGEEQEQSSLLKPTARVFWGAITMRAIRLRCTTR